MQEKKKLYSVQPFDLPFKVITDRVDAYQKVFGTEDGQRVLEDILSSAGFYSPERPEDYAFNAGKRSVCFGILNIINAKLQEIK